MFNKRRFLLVFLLVFTTIFFRTSAVGAQEPAVPDWPGLYDPFTLLDFNLEMDSGDWNTIVADLSYDIEVPALFSANGEAPILVSVRRKSADLLGADKISLKVDINEYTVEDESGNDVCDGDHGFSGPTCVSKWHEVKKLSLENGDDNNVVTEGLAWYLHSQAAEAMNYQSGMASWVTVTVNGSNKGVYVNVEQPDKQYLKNRDLWDGNDTWLYKYSDIDSPEIKEYPEDLSPVEYNSPLYDRFCFSPFQIRKSCPSPTDFKDQLNANINMEGLLTFGAVSAFQGSPDDLYPKDKNFYFVDYTTADKGLREYLEWDLDSAFTGNKADADIYNQSTRKSDYYEKALVESPDSPFRAEYDAIMWRLLDGPFAEDALFPAFDQIYAAIGAAVDADPNNKMGQSAAGTFANLKQFVSERRANVISQLPPRPEPTNTPAPPTPTPEPTDTPEPTNTPAPPTPTPEPTDTPQPTTTMHVGDLTGMTNVDAKGKWTATVTITVHDSADGPDGPVTGAVVSGVWSGDYIATASCTTDGSGQCAVSTSTLNKNKSSVTFGVTNLSGALTYEPADNFVTQIPVSKP